LFGTPAPATTWFPARMAENLAGLSQADWRAVLLGVGSFAVMWAARKHRRIPSGLLVIVCGTTLAWLLGWKESLITAGDIGPITGTLPLPLLPVSDLSLVIALLPAAAAVAIIGLIEAVSIGQSLALKHQEHLNTNQEFFGQGLSQVVGAFFQCIPGSGSFSRTALIEQGGAQTRVAHLIFSAATVLALVLIPGALAMIPVPCLAGLLLYVGVRLMDHRRIRRVFRTSREDAWVLAMTCLITVLLKVEYGLFAGVLLGNVLFLRRTRSLHMPEVVPYPDGRLEERAYTPGSVHSPASLVALTVYGDLFYGVARELREQLLEVVNIQKPRIIIVRIRRVFSIDYACWNALFEFAEWFKNRGGALYISGVRPDALELIHAAGAQDALPENQVFPKTERLMEAFHIAVAAGIVNLPEGTPKPVHWEAYLDTRKRGLDPI
jgi:sulfate permease, SulP family